MKHVYHRYKKTTENSLCYHLIGNEKYFEWGQIMNQWNPSCHFQSCFLQFQPPARDFLAPWYLSEKSKCLEYFLKNGLEYTACGSVTYVAWRDLSIWIAGLAWLLFSCRVVFTQLAIDTNGSCFLSDYLRVFKVYKPSLNLESTHRC